MLWPLVEQRLADGKDLARGAAEQERAFDRQFAELEKTAPADRSTNKAAEALTSIGVVAAAVRRRSTVRRAAGLALLAGSALTRFAIFEAAVASAEDPKYTVLPPRERLGEAA